MKISTLGEEKPTLGCGADRGRAQHELSFCWVGENPRGEMFARR